jgi:hypothetical protein
MRISSLINNSTLANQIWKIEADAKNLRDAKFNFDPGRPYSLAELVKLAEAHHPETRLALRSPTHL